MNIYGCYMIYIYINKYIYINYLFEVAKGPI